MHFPANRELNSEFVGFHPDLSPGFGVQLAEFIALMNVSCNPESKRNRELIPRISENGFPVSVPKRNFVRLLSVKRTGARAFHKPKGSDPARP